MFSKEEKLKEWSKLIERYISLHKYLKAAGKKWISQGRSGSVSADVQVKLGEALSQADKGLFQLKDFFRPYLDTTDMFVEDKFKREVQTLTEENANLKHENSYLLKLNQEYKMYDHSTNPHLLQMQENFEKEQLMLNADKQNLQEQVKTLEEQCQMLVQEIQELTFAEAPAVGVTQGNGKLQIFRRKQQQFDETLKAQNDLIEDLKQQLENANRERDIMKSLNRDLENEFQKKTYTPHANSDVEDYGPESFQNPERSAPSLSSSYSYELPKEQKSYKMEHRDTQKTSRRSLEEELHDLQPNSDSGELQKGDLEKNILKIGNVTHTHEDKKALKHEYSDLQQQLQELQLENEKLSAHHGINSASQKSQETENSQEIGSLGIYIHSDTDMQ